MTLKGTCASVDMICFHFPPSAAPKPGSFLVNKVADGIAWAGKPDGGTVNVSYYRDTGGLVGENWYGQSGTVVVGADGGTLTMTFNNVVLQLKGTTTELPLAGTISFQ